MAKKVKNTEYLMLSSMIRAREAGMLSRERMDRMISAPNFQEAAKLLTDCGYEDMSNCDAAGVNAALNRRRAEVFAELANMVPILRSCLCATPPNNSLKENILSDVSACAVESAGL